MGQTTNISWTDHSFNPWWGCTKVSPGCDNCYAEAFDKRVGGAHWGKGVPRRTFGDAHWNEPLKWDRTAYKEGCKTLVFCASMADVMDDEAPEGERKRLWELVDQTPNLIWQLLTKRPHRFTRYLPANGFKHENVWLGVTAESQGFYNARWPILRIVAAEYGCTSWISYEPAIGPLVMADCPLNASSNPFVEDYPDWAICGGESGHGRREFKQQWAEDLRGECQSTGTAFFMKQMGAQTPAKGSALIPAHLLIREIPGMEADDEGFREPQL